MMNRNDERFGQLQQRTYDFLTAETIEEKYLCNAPFVEICQDVLKAEWDLLKKDLANASRASDKGGD